MFAPSTVAISAIILSFSTLRIDCKPWLDCVPNKCFRRSQLDDKDSLLLDIDKCLDTFQRIEKIHRTLPKNSTASPTSITAAPPSPCTLLINEGTCCKMMNPKTDFNATTISSNHFLVRGIETFSSEFNLDNLDIEAIEKDSSLNSPATFCK